MREPGRRALFAGIAGIALLLGSAAMAAGRPPWAPQQIAVAVTAGSENLVPVVEEAYFELPLFARDRQTTAEVRLVFATMPRSQPLIRKIYGIRRDEVTSGSSADYSERQVDEAPNNEIHLDLIGTNDGTAHNIEIAFLVEIKNATKQPMTAMVLNTIPGEWRMLDEHLPHTRRNGNQMLVAVAVPAEGSTTLSYRLRTRLPPPFFPYIRSSPLPR
jgi:hypothetical protein